VAVGLCGGDAWKGGAEETGAPGLCPVDERDEGKLLRLLEEGAAGVIVGAEAVTRRFWDLLRESEAGRPWSLLPCLLLTTDGADPGDEEAVVGDRPVIVLERPLAPKQLHRALRAALHIRRQQYRVRDLLMHLRASNEKLRSECDDLQQHRNALRSRIAVQVRQLRDLALAVTTAEQEERARLARMLHDHFQHYIHGAKMWAETQRDEADAAPPDTLDRIVDLLDEALHLTRSFSVDLSPPVLRTDGLRSAFEWLSDHMREAHDLRVDLRVSPSFRVPSQKMRILLFECTRELLFNVAKHAGTRKAVLAASMRPSPCDNGADGLAATVVVRDRGGGFEPAAAADAPDAGLGLRAVRRRLRLVGGQTTIESAPGKGTTVRLHVPLSPDASCTDDSTAPTAVHPLRIYAPDESGG
jgi:signal transduction histidine kinase